MQIGCCTKCFGFIPDLLRVNTDIICEINIFYGEIVKRKELNKYNAFIPVALA